MMRNSWLSACGVLVAVVVLAPLRSEPVRSEPLINEIKIGGLYHDVPNLWSGFQIERRSADLNVEAIFGPHIVLPLGVLRPALGANINTSGATSRVYADVRWQWEGANGLFLSLGIGAAVHDGKTGPTEPDMKALGSRLLFHIPAELGWRWDGRNSVSVYFEHVSNGYTQKYNEGLDAIGVRYGYRFGGK